ncbi:YcjF family protein [Paracoccus pacificus]|uniref:YcjF family protein n=1 Tax=Paracoccus pacificus TaxID=1463598 RepID=A0ABW4R800_9RHOB
MTDDSNAPGQPPRRRGPVLIDLGPSAAPRGDRGQPPDLTDSPEPGAERPRPQVRISGDDAGGGPGHAPADPPPSPADVPPISDDPGPAGMPSPRTMEMVTRIASARPSPIVRFFINTGVALFTFLLSVAALSYISNLITRFPFLGWIGAGLFILFTLAALAMAWREYRAWAQFARIDAISRDSAAALESGDLGAARAVVGKVTALYANRPELQWGRARLAEREGEAFDAVTLIGMAEAELLAPLDAAARREIEAASRTVAAATALVPLAFADVATALVANLRMIRRMAEIYGGRAGAVGGWRLARNVMAHLVATGAVAGVDDMVHTVAGGGLLAKLSRRFGEGVINGALTARVGIAAMEVCRPLPFVNLPHPRVTNIVSRALTGLFGRGDDEKSA